MNSIKLPDSDQTGTFRAMLPQLTEKVVEAYKHETALLKLKGTNPLVALEKAQLYLGKTLLTVFEYSNIELHLRTLPWVYRSYRRHGFHDDYFKTSLKLWISAINSLMINPEVYTEFLEYMLSLDSKMKKLANITPETFLKKRGGKHFSEKELRKLMTALLCDDSEKIEMLLVSYYQRGENFFLEETLMPVMYETGRLWELDKITVADEHRISAIISGFIASMHKEELKRTIKKILITPAPNEYHEIGALLLAETFRKKNWAVTYLNAGTPTETIINHIAKTGPDIIAISTALILHASPLRSIVKSIKEKYPLIPVILGGKFINENPEVLELLGADGTAENIQRAFELAVRLTE